MSKCSHCDFNGGSDEYLDHVCSTGFKPTQPEHQDALSNGRFSKVSAAAIKRGAERKKLEEEE
jgi:hypothetical protein